MTASSPYGWNKNVLSNSQSVITHPDLIEFTSQKSHFNFDHNKLGHKLRLPVSPYRNCLIVSPCKHSTMIIDKIGGTSKMYLDITLNGASFERQEQFERLYYKKSRQRRKSTDHVPIKKMKRSMQVNMSLLNYVSFFLTNHKKKLGTFYFHVQKLNIYLF